MALVASNNLLIADEATSSSEEELSGGEVEFPESHSKDEEIDLMEKLLRKYIEYLSSLKKEFSKKKKKGKLPSEAMHVLLYWWAAHYKWPYPTLLLGIEGNEADKILLAETTGLDQKQVNNWFINQRKRHWKPSENMQFAIVDGFQGSSIFADD
ncbi:hypothetical protein KSP40_PGU022360 [Platanthera guangdongensis]|uniref:Uncharacterized protein n=1 Tax=Platanthera guangdongensis TaxID=2320717 RepID=A0ABR2LBF7_9ASPA